MRIEAVPGANTHVSYNQHQQNTNHVSSSEAGSEVGYYNEADSSLKTSKHHKEVIMPKHIIQMNQVNPVRVNPCDCTYKEFVELLSVLSEHKRYENYDFSMPSEFEVYEKDEQKRDYLKMLSHLRTEQAYRGNVVGEHQIDRMYVALCDARDEVQDTVRYIDGNRVYHEAGLVRTAPLFDSYSILDDGVERTYYLQYANDSTAENPIIEVFQYDQSNNVYGHTRININNVNPRNASLQEMFALYSHNELQSAVSKHDDWSNPPLIDWGQSDFHRGYVNELFRVSSSIEFQEQKNDWIELQMRNPYENKDLSRVVLDMLKELHDSYLEHIERQHMEEEVQLEKLLFDRNRRTGQ